ncbi:MAG: dihydroorotate dehydrogenase electron transfer subunit [Chloroflexi bacterium]|nr:dihydroorotate dehydrogenase electron transfer subunit [Chloroflexota bacterium]
MSDGYRALRIVRRIVEGTAGVTLELEGSIEAEPGQFVMVWLPRIEERPFSLVDTDPPTLTIACVGPFTRALCARREGERLWIRGPYGRGYDLVGERHLLLGGGSGAASLALLARRALAIGHQVRAVLGARSASLLMLPWKLRALGCEVILATDDGSAGFQGTALQAAEAHSLFDLCDSVYTCGPEAMLRAVCSRVQELSLPGQVSLERTMKCGLGVCGVCHVGDRLVCRDGPVFACQELVSLWAPEADQVSSTEPDRACGPIA